MHSALGYISVPLLGTVPSSDKDYLRGFFLLINFKPDASVTDIN